jgi:glycosyltransferase involved in cell wall biosynthesis
VVAALAHQSLDAARMELVIVEDAKNDVRIDLPQVPFAARVLRAEQRGASHARNVGWRAAAHPVVLFLGDDIVPVPELVARHAAIHDAHPGSDVGALGHVRWARELRRDAFMAWLDYGIQFSYPTICDGEAGPGHFYSSNVSVKRSILEEVGGFDAERFPFLYEDIDLGARLFARGFRLRYDAQAIGEHLHRPDLDRWKARMEVQAGAEREWARLHPEQTPYFHSRFAAAMEAPPSRGRMRWLLRWVPRTTPVIGERVYRRVDLYFRQQLAPSFLAAWDRQ